MPAWGYHTDISLSLKKFLAVTAEHVNDQDLGNHALQCPLGYVSVCARTLGVRRHGAWLWPLQHRIQW